MGGRQGTAHLASRSRRQLECIRPKRCPGFTLARVPRPGLRMAQAANGERKVVAGAEAGVGRETPGCPEHLGTGERITPGLGC